MRVEDGVLTDVQNKDLKILKTNPAKFWEGVKEIGPKAFMFCTDLNEIKVPEGITKIHKEAFVWLNNLKKVILPSSLTKIGKSAFARCRKLEEINLPESLTEIGEDAFFNCALTAITLPKNLKILEGSVFKWCSYLREIKLPEGLTKICDSAFDSCDLKEIKIPKSVKIIESHAFSHCSLESIDLSNVNELGGYVLYSCPDLLDVKLNDELKEIPNGTFYACLELKSFNFPKNCTAIGEDAFGSTGFESLEIPDSIETIGEEAFSDCDDLKYVKLPKNLKVIPANCFLGDEKLTKIDLPENVEIIEKDAFYETGIKELYVPDSVREFQPEYSSFLGLKKISVPNAEILDGLGYPSKIVEDRTKIKAVEEKRTNLFENVQDRWNDFVEEYYSLHPEDKPKFQNDDRGQE